MRKKGSVLDVMIVVILSIAAALSIMVSYLVLTEILVAFQSTPTSNVTEVTTIMETGIEAIAAMDGIFTFMIVGLIVVSLVFAYYAPTHPLMLLPAIFIWGFIIFVSAQYSNLFWSLQQTTQLASVTTEFPLMAAICLNFPLVALVHGIMILIATYTGRGRGDALGQYY